MFWLYLIALSVLAGAEFNAQRAAKKREDTTSRGTPIVLAETFEIVPAQAEAPGR